MENLEKMNEEAVANTDEIDSIFISETLFTSLSKDLKEAAKNLTIDQARF